MSRGRHQTPKPPNPHLTRREREVGLLIGAGLSDKEVAQRLGISVKTAATHGDNARRKLKLNSRFKLIQLVANGLLAIALLLCGCATKPKQRAADLQSAVRFAELNLASVGETAGPAGVLSSDCGFTWILPRTNRYVLVETKDYLHNGVIRYLHDQEVYGTSLVIWPGPVSPEHPELPDTLNPAAFFRTRYTTNTP